MLGQHAKSTDVYSTGDDAEFTRGQYDWPKCCESQLGGDVLAKDEMIARIWHGRVPVAKSERYLHLMRRVAIPDYQAIPGNLDAICLHRIEDDIAHFEMLTFWDNVEAIKRFAGEDYAAAKYYDFDDEYLIEKEPHVRHFEAYRQ